MKRFIKLILIISGVFFLPKLSNAQGKVYMSGSTQNNIVVARNASMDDSAHLFGPRDTSNHSYPPGALISFNNEPYWWNGIFWFKINGDTSSPVQVNSDWTAVSGVAKILNKPTLATVATSGAYADLTGKPTIPAAQVSTDWNALSGISQVLNRPRIVDSIYRIIGKDSIFIQIREAGTTGTNTVVTYAILDSAGGGGGSGSVDSVFIDNFPPLYNVSVINQGIKPHFTFNPINAPAFSVLSNLTSGSAAYGFNVPNSTIINQWYGGSGVQPLISSLSNQIIYNNGTNLGGNNELLFTHVGTQTNLYVGTSAANDTATLVLGGSNAVNGVGIVSSADGPLFVNGFGSLNLQVGNNTKMQFTASSIFVPVLPSGGANDSIMTWNSSTGKWGVTTRTFNLFPVEGLKSYGTVAPNDSIGIGGFFYQNDSINLNFYGLYLQNMIHKASLAGTDSIVGIQVDGELFKVPASAVGGGGGGGPTIYTADGNLAGNRTVSGANNLLSLGSSGSKVSSLQVFATNNFQFTGGTYISNPGSQVSIQDGTINNAVTVSSGTVSNYSSNYFGQPTITSTNTGIVYQGPATVEIKGPPILSTNSTSTNPYALKVDIGNTFLGGNIALDSNAKRTAGDGTNNFLSVNAHQYLSNNNEVYGIGSAFFFQWNINNVQVSKILSTGQYQLGSGSGYSFSGTAVNNLAVDAGGNVITVSTSGGSSGIGTDSVQTYTSSTTSVTQTSGYNQMIIDPTTPYTSLTITLAGAFHSSNNLFITFGQTNIQSGLIAQNVTVVPSGSEYILGIPIGGNFNANDYIWLYKNGNTIYRRH